MSTASARPGPFPMLLWKEWRQQRWTLLGMSVLALALFVLGGTLLRRWSFELSEAAFVFAALGIPLVLSAQAYASEDEDGTAVFLRELPFRPLQVFAAKLLVVVLASWAALGLVLLVGLMWSNYPENAVWGLPWVPVAAARAWRNLSASVAWVGIWLLAPTAASLGSLLASLGLRSLTTVLLAGAWLCLCVACGALSVLLLAAAQVRGSAWVPAAVGLPVSGVLLAAWFSAQRHPRKLLQFLRSGCGCAGILAACLLPGVLPQVCFHVLKPPTYYVRSDWRHQAEGWVNSIAIPSSSRPTAIALEIALVSDSETSGDASLLALLDLSTGRTAWSGVWPAPMDRGIVRCRPIAWSPGGSRVTWAGGPKSTAEQDVVWPAYRAGALPGQGKGATTGRAELRVYDVRTRRTIRVPGDLATAVLERCRCSWYNNTWLAALWLGSRCEPGVAFVNTDSGVAHACPMSLDEPVWQGGSMPRMVVSPDRAVALGFWRETSWPECKAEYVIAIATPSATVATLLPVRDLPPRETELRAVSPDARWALLAPDWWVPESGPRPNLALVDLRTGASRPLILPPGILEHMAARRGGPVDSQFAAGGRCVLVDSRDVDAVYDVERDTWQTYVLPAPDGTAIERGASVSPNGQRVLKLFHTKRSSDLQAVVLDLVDGHWTTVPLPLGPRVERGLGWCGDDFVLALSRKGVWRAGLDGRAELLYRCTDRGSPEFWHGRPPAPGLAGVVAWCRQVLEEEP
jgi:hypothetical protein